MKVPRILCLTSDKYLDAVKPFLWLLRKYWKEGTVEVLVCGFSEPDFPLNDGKGGNVHAEFHSIGKFKDYPLDKWSNALIDLIKQIPDELAIIMLEDYWVTREMNVPAVSYAMEYMERFHKTLKFDLAADRYFAGGAIKNYAPWHWLDLVKSDPMSAYHMSLMTGMWRMDLLKEVIRKNWSPWDIEIEGTRVLQKSYPDLEVIGTAQWPVKHTLAFRGGDASELLLSEINKKDVYAMKSKGLLAPWGVQ